MSAENLNNFCAITYLERTPVSFGPGVFLPKSTIFKTEIVDNEHYIVLYLYRENHIDYG